MIRIKPIKVNVSAELIAQWQDIVDNMAELANVPAGLIMRIVEEDIEVFISSYGEENPYVVGNREHLEDSGLYCETVIKTKRPLTVVNCLDDPDWKDNPDVELNMIAYMGVPVLFPDGTPFGTLCILDNKQNEYSDKIRRMLGSFRSLVEAHIALLYMNAALDDNYRSLVEYLDELRALRGIIPICMTCKKVKNESGQWYPIEKYLLLHPDADISHGYCPGCGSGS